MSGEKRMSLLEVFFREPSGSFYVRELSRKTDMSPPTVKRYIEELIDEGLICKNDEHLYPTYSASINDKYKLEKKLYNIRKLHETGLVEKIKEKCLPDAVVLFGSAANGEDVEKSDIDILVVSGSKDLETSATEKELGRKVNITFMNEDELKKNNEFANSVANGVVLEGYLVVR